VPEGLISSFPVRADGRGGWEIVQGLDLEPFLKDRIGKTVRELQDEREVVKNLLG
jgi:malate dehydrogenase